MPFQAAPKRTAGLTLDIPETNVAHNLKTSAERYPSKTALVYYDSPITYAELWRDVEALAGTLERAGAKRGDRVVLYMQNSPQWITAYYAILRANAAVVPLNPMLVSAELAKYVDDSGARIAIAGSELADRIVPYCDTVLDALVIAHYADALRRPTELSLPPGVGVPMPAIAHAKVIHWADAIDPAGAPPGPMTAAADDIAVMPYTSGTTGAPKGCVHTHRSVNATTFTGLFWGQAATSGVQLSCLPFFHVTGMTVDMNVVLALGATLVMLTRWDAPTAIALMQRYQVTGWVAISTMVVDLLSRPEASAETLASVQRISGGGAPLPVAVSERLFVLTGLRYMEGYGLSETIATTHANPAGAEKAQCLGIPTFNVDSRIIDPETLRELAPGEVGEIITAGPQVMREYWHKPELNAETFIERDGKRFLRTGDLGYVDDEGYFFMVDRLKRMINAAGFKVWPAEVETQLFAHPAVKEACVIATIDARRGETTKALIVLRDGVVGDPAEIIAWSKTKMAAYKVPTIVEFVDALPRAATGKVAWRELQEAELRRTGTPLVAAP